MFKPVKLMMVLALLCVTAPACSVIDEGSRPWSELVSKINAMPDGDLRVAKREEARRRALDELKRRDPNDRIGTVHCSDSLIPASDEEDLVRGAFHVDDALRCLSQKRGDVFMTFAECVSAWSESHIDLLRKAHTLIGRGQIGKFDCYYVPDTSFDESRDWNPDNIDADDLARSAVSSPSPPAWMIAAGIVVVGAGGVFVLASGWPAVLCPLGADYACPQTPDGSGTQPGSSSASGGDQP